MATNDTMSRSRGWIAARAALFVAAIAALVGTATALAGPNRGPTLADLRQATVAFQDIAAAEAAGYGPFYICTDENSGKGAMGQHYVKGALVGDPAIDPLHPEAVMYEPKPGGGLKLVGVEYVVIQADWEAANGAGTTPSVFGQPLKLVGSPNRYGLPPFFQRHVWL